MDRDMVNCLHYLYHLAPIPLTRLDETSPYKLFWCASDTRYPFGIARW